MTREERDRLKLQLIAQHPDAARAHSALSAKTPSRNRAIPQRLSGRHVPSYPAKALKHMVETPERPPGDRLQSSGSQDSSVRDSLLGDRAITADDRGVALLLPP